MLDLPPKRAEQEYSALQIGNVAIAKPYLRSAPCLYLERLRCRSFKLGASSRNCYQGCDGTKDLGQSETIADDIKDKTEDPKQE